MDKGGCQASAESRFALKKFGSKRLVALPARLAFLFVANLAVRTQAVHAVCAPEEGIIAGWNRRVWSCFYKHALPAETPAQLKPDLFNILHGSDVLHSCRA